MTFEKITTEDIYKGRIFTVRSEKVKFPDGRVVSLDILEHGGAVVIVPQAADGAFVMVKQYRHASKKMLLEFPAGTLEIGEDPVKCAQRELREETGYSAKRLERLGGFFLAPGYSTEYLHVFLATDLQESPLPQDADEWLEVVHISSKELFELVGKGQLEDAKSLASLFLLRTNMSTKNTT